MAARIAFGHVEGPALPASSVVRVLLGVLLGLAGAIGFSADVTSSSLGQLAATLLTLITGLCAIELISEDRTLRVRATYIFTLLIVAFAVAGTGAWLALTGVAVVSLATGHLLLARSHVAHDEITPDEKLQDLLRSMVLASEIRDHQTADHSDRVARNCRLVGEFLGLTEDDIVGLEWAARVHDVGKAAIPREILQKPASLSESEMETVKQHCEFGAAMLIAASPALRPIAQLVRHHHENWDGTGYPVGLVASEIPLESRIIAVIDMYEALTSDRPYRPAMDSAAAHAEVLSRSGTRFDPDVVRIFDELWRRGAIETWSTIHPRSRASGAPAGEGQHVSSTVFARLEPAIPSTGW